MTLLDRLEQLARAATPGPWTRDYSDDTWREVAVTRMDSGTNVHVWSSAKRASAIDDAEYIAAASPDVVLKLIAVARAAAEIAECAPVEDDDHDDDGSDDCVWCRANVALAALEDA